MTAPISHSRTLPQHEDDARNGHAHCATRSSDYASNSTITDASSPHISSNPRSSI
eukprot:IDg3548t1